MYFLIYNIKDKQKLSANYFKSKISLLIIELPTISIIDTKVSLLEFSSNISNCSFEKFTS